MAILKAGKVGKSLAGAIRYAGKDAIKAKNPDLATGVNCSDEPSKAVEVMQFTKNLWGKAGGRQYKSYIQSFAKDEVTPEQANQLGNEWAEKAFGKNGYEVFVGTHINSKSGIIHNHIIVNSVNYLDGHKIQMTKGHLNSLKNINDQVCRNHGLSVIDRSKASVEKRGRIQAWSNEKYNYLQDKNNWMKRAAEALDKTLLYGKPQTAKMFCEMMDAHGWTVKFRGEKHITLLDKKDSTKKVRVDTLAKTFNQKAWTKESITKGFNQDKLKPANITTASKKDVSVNKKITKKGVKDVVKKVITAPIQLPVKMLNIASAICNSMEKSKVDMEKNCGQLVARGRHDNIDDWGLLSESEKADLRNNTDSMTRSRSR